mgnify:CR=1 FL=1
MNCNEYEDSLYERLSRIEQKVNRIDTLVCLMFGGICGIATMEVVKIFIGI